MRILMVEDERRLARAVRSALSEAGYAVDVVHDGDEVRDWVKSYRYDLLILDLVLPGRSGLEVCRDLRAAHFPAPILMLTALDQVDDRVRGLDAGADDYLPKPFALAELLARVRALARRTAGDRMPVQRVADLELDPARREVRRGGRPIHTTAKEYALLETLVRHRGQVLTRDRLVDAVWDADFAAGSNVLEVYVRSLRRKIDQGRRDGLIETVRGTGYRLRADAAESLTSPEG